MPAANAVGPGKRPRSSMSPAFVFGANGRLTAVVGFNLHFKTLAKAAIMGLFKR